MIPNDIFRIDELTPLGLGECPPLEEEHKLIHEDQGGKKGRPKGLKNDANKPKKPKVRDSNTSIRKGHWGAD